jgi:hypothetical protein
LKVLGRVFIQIGRKEKKRNLRETRKKGRRGENKAILPFLVTLSLDIKR